MNIILIAELIKAEFGFKLNARGHAAWEAGKSTGSLAIVLGTGSRAIFNKSLQSQGGR